MPSKSKAQRAFLIKVVADADFAKSRKMSQDVARGILDEDEEHIAKDKHWADHLPDRAGGHSMESRVGDVWYNPEYIDLLVEQQVHPSFESMSDKFKSLGAFLLGKKHYPTQSGAAKPAEVTHSNPHYKTLSVSPEDARVVKTGTGDFSSYASALRMKTTPTPFWNGLLKMLDQYVDDSIKIEKSVVEYCNKCKAIYKKCETMQPKEARAYAETEMRKIGLKVPAKPNLPFADFEVEVGPHGATRSTQIPGKPQRIICEMPTQTQLDKLKELTRKLFLGYNMGDGYWTLDDTDEIKWWDHHFPGQSEDWGPMIDLFPFAGEVKGYDDEALSKSNSDVSRALMSLIVATSDLKSDKAE